jgi:hypothetical protein
LSNRWVRPARGSGATSWDGIFCPVRLS